MNSRGTDNPIDAELLLGRRVLALNYHSIGRIEELHIRREGKKCFVEHFLIGSYGLLARLAAWRIGLPVIRLLGSKGSATKYKVPWQKLDLSDPARPRLNCPVQDLETID